MSPTLLVLGLVATFIVALGIEGLIWLGGCVWNRRIGLDFDRGILTLGLDAATGPLLGGDLLAAAEAVLQEMAEAEPTGRNRRVQLRLQSEAKRHRARTALLSKRIAELEFGLRELSVMGHESDLELLRALAARFPKSELRLARRTMKAIEERQAAQSSSKKAGESKAVVP